MEELSIIGIDLAKSVFQVHGAAADGSVLFRKKLSRGQVLSFLSKQPLCLVAMEACASAHFWGREIEQLGHSVRLIPPAYVKPYVKRQKNDAADAEAIAEAASRPGMRFVAIKTPEQQTRAMIFRTRDLLVRQRTQLINALRGHLAEHGLVAAQGTRQVKKLEQAIEEDDGTLPPLVCEIGRTCLDQIADLSSRIDLLTKELRRHASGYETSVLLQSIPGIGPITALAIDAFAPLSTAEQKPTKGRRKTVPPCLGEELVPEVHRRAPRAARTAYHGAKAVARVGGTCGPSGSSGCRSVGLGLVLGFALLEAEALAIQLEDMDVMG